MRWVLVFLLLLPTVSALEGNIPLLAVSETADGLHGSFASLSLEVREGKGRVFLETNPVTKVDTQISMRFAQQIACSEAGIDCSEFDFIYTVRAESGIVGGPSAGAPATALTYGLLMDEDLRDDVAITGTINSGGLIGTVGGLREKISAAASQNMSAVLIPEGSRYAEINNLTLDLVAYGAELDVIVVEVSSFDDVLYALTGKKKVQGDLEINVDPEYSSMMGDVATELCSRSSQLRDVFYESRPVNLNESHLRLENATSDLHRKGIDAMSVKDYYSAASFCFRTGVNYASLHFGTQNLTQKEVDTRVKLLRDGVKRFRSAIKSQDIDTITELQSSIVVLDRLAESEEYINLIRQRRGEDVSFLLSFATERLHSASSWSTFFSLPGTEWEVDESKLALSCTRKIQEAQERYQYVQFYLPNSIGAVRNNIEDAMQYQKAGDYALCLFTAAQAKAESNVIVGVIGASSEHLDSILDRKLEAVHKVIAKSQQKGFFPIIGYSYYQYADSLKDHDRSSALLFSEYALELSSLDLYFPQTTVKGYEIEPEMWFIFLLGVIVGSAVFALLKR
ncbi:MAG: S16 family serine protease [Candidatus Nanoarchaeia archaeon]